MSSVSDFSSRLASDPEWSAATVAHGEAQIEYFVRGSGKQLVVLLPSLGRPADDFSDLGRRLDAAGFRVAAVNPRGVGRSVGRLEGINLGTLAANVHKVIAASGGRAFVVGHAFGQRIARLLARNHPEAVIGLGLLAAGGQVPGEPDAAAHGSKSFDLSLPEAERLEHVARAYFAPGKDARVWLDGWYADAAEAQRKAFLSDTPEDWWEGGTVPILIVQPALDRQAPPANAEFLVGQLGARVELVIVDWAAHALLPEQPEAVAEAVVGWLQRQSAGVAS